MSRAFLTACLLIAPFRVMAESPDTLANDLKQTCAERELVPGATAACVESKDALYGARLAKTYTALKESLPAEQRTRLIQGQRAWLSYVKTACALVEWSTRPESPSWALVNRATCNLAHTLRRLEELDRLKDITDGR